MIDKLVSFLDFRNMPDLRAFREIVIGAKGEWIVMVRGSTARTVASLNPWGSPDTKWDGNN